MSHQTGIRCGKDLLCFFAKAKSSKNIRSFKVHIENEKLVLVDYQYIQSDWVSDYDRILNGYVEDKQPCYIFFQLDEQGDSSANWLFIFWSPDDSPIKQKMLYASTKATIKKEFGLSYISSELFATTKSDTINLSNQLNKDKIKLFNNNNNIGNKYLTDKPPINGKNICQDIPSSIAQHFSKNGSKVGEPCHTSLHLPDKHSKLLTNGTNNQNLAGVSVDTKQKSIHGLAFPFTEQLIEVLTNFRDSKLNYIRMKINIEKEEIDFDNSSKNPDIHSVQRLVPISNPRYHIYRYRYIYQNNETCDIVFIYSMPGHSSCSIKERMLYSSCKHKVIEYIKNTMQISIIKTFEIEAGGEITADFLVNELHPPPPESQEKFSKPKGPASRGPRRITKNI